ncbi:heat- and acid-stable phosphoprotein [Mortierella polycephala]|uniref:Heat- and acid-stable phosphoprotein n=1 Tax=Mortierella polycephala TaxID=41804 RepID=A0A9P6PIR4_9FUNG|nr:heat- and acid-stable phosphoprotein [Mortierella polycephala]
MAGGKFKKPQRGGGRNFSRRIEAVHTSNSTTPNRDRKNPSSDFSAPSVEHDHDNVADSNSSGSGSESEESEVESDNTPAAQTMTNRKPPAVPGIEINNPNHRTIVTGRRSDVMDMSTPIEMSRKEREAAEKEAAKQRYWKLHQEGKTDEAKADMARLTIVRKQREEAAARRLADAKAKIEANAAKFDALRL